MLQQTYKSSHYDDATEEKHKEQPEVPNYFSRTIEISPKRSGEFKIKTYHPTTSHGVRVNKRKHELLKNNKDKVQEDSYSESKTETYVDKTHSTFGEKKTDDSPLVLICDASATEREMARAINLNARKNSDLAKAGMFNYETYNAILSAKNPDVILTTGQTYTKKSVQQMIDETFWLPLVEEINDNMRYEELSVMKHPAELHHYESCMPK